VRKDNAILSIAINSMERDVLYEQLTQVSEGELFGDLKVRCLSLLAVRTLTLTFFPIVLGIALLDLRL
jgi:hypothetical protein